MHSFYTKVIRMSINDSKTISHVSRWSNMLHIFKKIFDFIEIIDDILEYIIFIFKIDGHSVILLYLRKPTGDSWGLLTGDLWQYFLTPCKKFRFLLILSTPNAILIGVLGHSELKTGLVITYT